MPSVSLVVCLYKERELLERLLKNSAGCYDDLVVVHDGVEGESQESGIGSQDLETAYEEGWKSPEELSLREPDAPPIGLSRDYAELKADAPIPTGYRFVTGKPKPGSIHELVNQYGGRFYEGPRCFQQEPHWPFAWWAAKHDWILRLDADEFPSSEMRDWLEHFRSQGSKLTISGYLGIWPLWDGNHEWWVGRRPSRLYLFDKKNVSFFGMAENNPVSDQVLQEVEVLLHHQPIRKSYGVANLLLRQQAYRWRRIIASSLLASPQKLPHWDLKSGDWPECWKSMRERPLWTALKRGLWAPVFQIYHETRQGSEFLLDAYVGTGCHQFLMAATVFMVRRRII